MFANDIASIPLPPRIPGRKPDTGPQPGRHAPVEPFLRYHRVIDPMPYHETGDLPGAAVWVSGDLLTPGSERRVFEWHLALQALLMRMEVLSECTQRTSNPRLGLLINNSLVPAYVLPRHFEGMRAEAGSTAPSGGDWVIFIDSDRRWLVVNVERAFIGKGPFHPSAAMISSLVLQAEAPTAVAAAARTPVLDTARKLVRHSLGESGVALSEESRQLARRLGVKGLIRWLLSGTPLSGSAQERGATSLAPV